MVEAKKTVDAETLAWLESRCITLRTRAIACDDGSPEMEDLISTADECGRLTRRARQGLTMPGKTPSPKDDPYAYAQEVFCQIASEQDPNTKTGQLVLRLLKEEWESQLTKRSV